MNGTLVSFQANGRTCDGYLSVPDSGGGPAVIVLQEWWGLVDHIKDVADRFANSGFTALAPDLYHGESTTQPDDAGRLMMALNIGETEKDLAGAVKFLVDYNSVSSDKVGTIGFCMGDSYPSLPPVRIHRSVPVLISMVFTRTSSQTLRIWRHRCWEFLLRMMSL